MTNTNGWKGGHIHTHKHTHTQHGSLFLGKEAASFSLILNHCICSHFVVFFSFLFFFFCYQVNIYLRELVFQVMRNPT
jgi:hypothetical protein